MIDMSKYRSGRMGTPSTKTITPVTAEFRPSMGFKLSTTAEFKRHLAKWHKLRNYRERIGSPLKYYGDLYAVNEIAILRNEIYKLKNRERMGLLITYGLLDTVDNVWMGNDKGPLTYDDLTIARIAAQTLDVQVGNKPGTIKAVEYDPRPKRLRDKVEIKMTTKEALDKQEKGLV